MKIELNREMNAYMSVDENGKPLRVADKQDWYNIIECVHIHVLFGTPLCGMNMKGLYTCPVCFGDSNRKCPLGYVKGMKITRSEDL